MGMGQSSTAPEERAGLWIPNRDNLRQANEFRVDWYQLTQRGRGAFGAVYDVFPVEDEKVEARKTMNDDEIYQADARKGLTSPAVTHVVKIMNKARTKKSEFDIELEVLQAVHGKPNVLQFHKVYETPLRLYLVLAKASGGTVGTSIFVRGYRPWYDLTDAQRQQRGIRYVHQMMTGLKSLHEANYTHNDLHGDNIMLSGPPGDDATQALIIDFGKCRRASVDYAVQLAKKADGSKTGEYGADIARLGEAFKDMNGENRFRNVKLKKLVKAVSGRKKMVEKLIKDAYDGAGSQFSGLFPAIAPGPHAAYQDKGGFQAGYSDDEGAVGGGATEGEGDDDGHASGDAKLARLKRVQRQLLAEQRNLQDDIERTEDRIRRLHRTRPPQEPARPLAQPVSRVVGVPGGGLNPFMAIVPMSAAVAMAMGQHMAMGQQQALPQLQQPSEVERLRRENRRLRGLLRD